MLWSGSPGSRVTDNCAKFNGGVITRKSLHGPIHDAAQVLAHSEACANHIIQVSDIVYSCQFHPEVNNQTVDGWIQIAGIPEVKEKLLGKTDVKQFHSSISNYL
jgi:hypothetical protein